MIDFYDQLNQNQMKTQKAWMEHVVGPQQEVFAKGLHCPRCSSPLRANPKQDIITWACMNIVTCNYSHDELKDKGD